MTNASGKKKFVYRAHAFKVELSADRVTFTPSASNADSLYHDGRWAVFLGVLALAAPLGSRALIRPLKLRDYVPWSESKASSIGGRIRKQILVWREAGLNPLRFEGITRGWWLSSKIKVAWIDVSPHDIDAQLSTPGLAVWDGGSDDDQFTQWLMAMVRASCDSAQDGIRSAEHQLKTARAIAPSPAASAAAAIELAVLRHGRPGADTNLFTSELVEFERLGGPLGRAVSVQRFNLELLDARTEQIARQILTKIESELRYDASDLGAGHRSSLLASAALACRRAGAYHKARTTATGGIVAGFVARDLRAVYRGVGELFLAGYQDEEFRNNRDLWCKWGLAAMKLEKHIPALRDSFVTPLVLVRALTFGGRLRWARQLLREIQTRLPSSARRTDRALAATCEATLRYAEASVEQRGNKRAFARRSVSIHDAYQTAVQLHDALRIPTKWFTHELESFRMGLLLEFSKRRRAAL